MNKQNITPEQFSFYMDNYIYGSEWTREQKDQATKNIWDWFAKYGLSTPVTEKNLSEDQLDGILNAAKERYTSGMERLIFMNGVSWALTDYKLKYESKALAVTDEQLQKEAEELYPYDGTRNPSWTMGAREAHIAAARKHSVTPALSEEQVCCPCGNIMEKTDSGCYLCHKCSFTYAAPEPDQRLSEQQIKEEAEKAMNYLIAECASSERTALINMMRDMRDDYLENLTAHPKQHTDNE